jgi:hypothetical protein
MTKQLSELEKLEQATISARKVIREAREAHKDLRACMREFEELIVQKANDLIASEMRLGMEMVTRQINLNTDAAIRATINRFDVCTSVLQEICEGLAKSQLLEELATVLQLTKLVEVGHAESIVRVMRSASATAHQKMMESETRTTLNGIPIATRFPGKL